MNIHPGPCLAALAACANLAATPAARAHEADGTSSSPAVTPNPAALVQLEEVRHAAARFLDVQAALDAGYVDIGVFYPNMGHHYLKPDILDDRFDAGQPELLVYVDDTCSGGRRLVAIEYAVPLALARNAPAGFVGADDRWTINQQFQLWTLHAWLYEYNPAGVFASHNVRVP